MGGLGRVLWIGSAVAFLAVAFIYPTTINTVPNPVDIPLPFDVINIPAMRNQLLLAIALAATFIAGVIIDVASTLVQPVQLAGHPHLDIEAIPVLRRDEDGDADGEQLATLGIVKVDGAWTYDGQRMGSWAETLNRAIAERRLRLR